MIKVSLGNSELITDALAERSLTPSAAEDVTDPLFLRESRYVLGFRIRRIVG